MRLYICSTHFAKSKEILFIHTNIIPIYPVFQSEFILINVNMILVANMTSSIVAAVTEYPFITQGTRVVGMHNAVFYPVSRTIFTLNTSTVIIIWACTVAVHHWVTFFVTVPRGSLSLMVLMLRLNMGNHH